MTYIPELIDNGNTTPDTLFSATEKINNNFQNIAEAITASGGQGFSFIRRALTGGGVDALDGIDGATIGTTDTAMVVVGVNPGSVYFYIINSALGGSENAPYVITPDTNAGDKRWVLAARVPRLWSSVSNPTVNNDVTTGVNAGDMWITGSRLWICISNTTGAAAWLEYLQLGTTTGTACDGADARLSNARTPTTHSHTVTDLPVGTSSSSVAAGNDARFHSNTNDPSAGEKAALVGSTGTPGDANRYVTATDPAMTNARTPTAHTHAIGDVTALIDPVDFIRSQNDGRIEAFTANQLTWTGFQIGLYDSANSVWKLVKPASAPTLANNADPLGSPTILTAGKNYDIFLEYVSATSATLVAAEWATDTARTAAYSSGTSYAVGDRCSYSGTYYVCIQAGSNHQPDTSPTYWVSNGADTEQPGLYKFEGRYVFSNNATGKKRLYVGIIRPYINPTSASAWSNSTTYTAGQRATSGGHTYVSLLDGNLNYAVTDTAWWQDCGLSYDNRGVFRKDDNYIGLANFYNAISAPVSVKIDTESWTYNSSTWRESCNGAVVRGDFVTAFKQCIHISTYQGVFANGAWTDAYIAIVFDTMSVSATAKTGIITTFFWSQVSMNTSFNCSVGRHYFTTFEGSGNLTFFGNQRYQCIAMVAC